MLINVLRFFSANAFIFLQRQKRTRMRSKTFEKKYARYHRFGNEHILESRYEPLRAINRSLPGVHTADLDQHFFHILELLVQGLSMRFLIRIYRNTI